MRDIITTKSWKNCVNVVHYGVIVDHKGRNSIGRTKKKSEITSSSNVGRLETLRAFFPIKEHEVVYDGILLPLNCGAEEPSLSNKEVKLIHRVSLLSCKGSKNSQIY